MHPTRSEGSDGISSGAPSCFGLQKLPTVAADAPREKITAEVAAAVPHESKIIPYAVEENRQARKRAAERRFSGMILA
jgi:hypothetical protein